MLLAKQIEKASIMYCYNLMDFMLIVIINVIFRTINSAPVSDGNGTNAGDLNGQKLIEIGQKLNLPKLQMIGKAIANVENEIQDKICDLHPCSDWTYWSGCNARVGLFGSKIRARHCNLNMTTCEIDPEGKTEKEFGICVGYCPEGYNITKNGFCLKLYADTRLKQDAAEQQCQKDGGHLVNIDSELKYEDVNSVLTGFINKGIYIDGRRKDVNSPWKYSYGSQKGFVSKWYPNEPSNSSNELCLMVAMHTHGLNWYDVSCSSSYYSICELVKA